MKKIKERLVYIDILKMFALLFVLNSHFVMEYNQELFASFPLGNIINGFSGKFGVIIFALLAGYSSYMSATKKKIERYVIERYLFFFICCVVANVLFYILNINGCRDNSTVGMLIGQSVMLSNYYCNTFWFIKDFLIGSIISFIAGKYRLKIVDQIFISLMFFMIGYPFIAFYVFGGVLYIVVNETEFYKNKVFKILSLVFFLIFFISIRKESNLTYLEDMLRASAIILLLSQIKFDNNIYRNVSYFFSSRTMAFIIAHNIAFHFLHNEKGLLLPVFYLVWFVFVCVVSVAVDFIIRYLYKFSLTIVDRFLDSVGI